MPASSGDRRRRRVSQADVARHAGVSTGIVSSVVNGRDYGSIRVSDATRERVRAAVRELGYIPNLAARNLARGSNRLIGVFTFLPLFPLATRDFYAEFLIGIEEQAEEVGYDLLLATGAKNELGARSVFAGGVNHLQLADGSVLLGSGEDDDELRQLTAQQYPFVFIGHREPPEVSLSFVAADYRSRTAAIVRELADLGHRRIALVQDGSPPVPGPGRRPGFDQGCHEAGISGDRRPQFALRPGPGQDPSVELVATPAALLGRCLESRVTAVVVESNHDAEQFVRAVLDSGRTVPDDLSVVALQVPPISPSEPVPTSHGGPARRLPDLAQLTIPRREMGREAVRLLLDLIGTGQPIRSRVACGFDRGGTVGAAPS